MKKYIIVFLAIILIGTQGVAIAADALYRMLHADEIESFKKDQDAIIVGQLIEHQDTVYNVKVLEVVSGKVQGDTIRVTDDFEFSWGKAKEIPQVEDYCVMSLKKKGSVYKKAWGIFKADSGDYKTLKLTAKDSLSSGLGGDLACIEWYVNSGGMENDFYFESNKAYVRRPNGQSVLLYPVFAPKRTTITQDSAPKEAPKEPENSISREAIGIPIITTVLLLGIFVYVKSKKSNANG